MWDGPDPVEDEAFLVVIRVLAIGIVLGVLFGVGADELIRWLAS
jgi:hypothetical protein